MSAPPIALTPEIIALIATNAPVVVGVSGGKDSQAAALATIAYLDSVGHTGPRLLIHSDLGLIEWTDSLPVCEKLADHLGLELVVLRRAAGDLLDRFEARWRSSVRRYIELLTVTVVLPWSTPGMRFCTSELKTHLIEAELKRLFPGQIVVNVTGVRREESTERKKGAVTSTSKDGKIVSWRPLSDWLKTQVFAFIEQCGLAVHEAYTKFCMSRVSCMFCIMSNLADLIAAAKQPEALPVLLRMVQLEIDSTFAFPGNRWLGDIASMAGVLPEKMAIELAAAKLKAGQRMALENQITKGMLYEKGWPVRMLSDAEATLLADVRRQMGEMFGIEVNHTTPDSIQAHYRALMTENTKRRIIKEAKAQRRRQRQEMAVAA